MITRYFVKYTIYDGEYEYGDQITYDLDSRLIHDADGGCNDAYVLNTIMGYIDPEDQLEPSSLKKGLYEDSTYRLYELCSVQKIPKADIKILNKYGV